MKGLRNSSEAFDCVPPVNIVCLVRRTLCLFVQRHVGPVPREGGAALPLFHEVATAKLISPHTDFSPLAGVISSQFPREPFRGVAGAVVLVLSQRGQIVSLDCHLSWKGR